MRKILLGAAALASLAYARLVGGPMDGTAFDVKMKADSMFAFSRHATLRFAKGQLEATVPMADGVETGTYQAQDVNAAGGTIWTAALSAAEHGVLSLQGLVRGDQIQGMAVLWRPDGKPERFLFKGTRRGE